jgi:O-methyltransferase
MYKDRLKAITAGLGLDVFRDGVIRTRERVVSGMHYRSIRPLATYAPWLDDMEFQRIYAAIRGNTLVDVFRCFELWELAGQVGHLPGDVIEVGVWRGGTGALLASRMKRIGGGKTVYLCDTFEGVAKAGAMDTTYGGGEHADTSKEIVEALARKLDLSNVRILKGIFPDDSKHIVESGQFCFVHIDVDVYQSAKEVLEFAWPRMPAGGLVVFDDYGFASCDGIPKLLKEYRGQSDKVILHNLNGHAIIVKTA